MITLIGYIPAWGLPDVSPFVTKIDCYLRMTGLPYELVKLPGGDLTKTPKGKLPVIKDGDKTVADSDFIVQYLKRTYGESLDARLSPRDKAVAVAFGRMLEESFYWYLVQMRYRRDEDFKIYDPVWVEFLDFVPPEARVAPVKEFRERILHEFYWSGKGRHTPEEVEQLAREEFDAILTYLGDKPYFMGEQPTSIDATLYAWLIHAMRVPFPSPSANTGMRFLTSWPTAIACAIATTPTSAGPDDDDWAACRAAGSDYGRRFGNRRGHRAPIRGRRRQGDGRRYPGRGRGEDRERDPNGGRNRALPPHRRDGSRRRETHGARRGTDSRRPRRIVNNAMADPRDDYTEDQRWNVMLESGLAAYWAAAVEAAPLLERG